MSCSTLPEPNTGEKGWGEKRKLTEPLSTCFHPVPAGWIAGHKIPRSEAMNEWTSKEFHLLLFLSLMCPCPQTLPLLGLSQARFFPPNSAVREVPILLALPRMEDTVLVTTRNTVYKKLYSLGHFSKSLFHVY